MKWLDLTSPFSGSQISRMSRDPTIDLSLGLRGAGLRAKLVVLEGPDEGLERALDFQVEVGADPSCQLVLRDPAVSRKHAEITLRAGRVHVKDLDSKNGTFLGGTRIGEAEVPLGALLRMGSTSIAVYPRWQVREVQPGSETSFGDLYGESVGMRELFAILERVAPSNVTVLVEGESGTGKELVARSLHAASDRAARPLVIFDCGAVPQNLAESELFGHKRGAFSGAIADRAGAFQQAHGGTIFLDEIGELPLDLQPRLLRVLESGQIRRVGDDEMRQIDVRVVAATNRDLHAEVRRGRFRNDLLYRLEVVKLRLPSLRQRPEDVAGIVAKLLHGKIDESEPIGGENLRRLMGYAWPGNVRELRNVLERAVAIARKPDGSLPRFSELALNLGPAEDGPATIGMSFPGVAYPLPYKQAKEQLLASFERAYVDALIDRHKGNLSKAAAAAELSRKYLYELLRRTRGETDAPEDPDDVADADETP